jgi:hypothetical protein
MADFEQKLRSSMQNVIFWKSSLLLSKSNVFGGLETPKIVKSLTTNALKTLVTKKTRLNTNVYRFFNIFGAPWEPPGIHSGALLGLLATSWSHLGHLGMPNAPLGMPNAHLGMPTAHLGSA